MVILSFLGVVWVIWLYPIKVGFLVEKTMEATASIVVVGNKPKGRISKWVFQENSTPNFPKNEHFLPSNTNYVGEEGGGGWG